MPNTKTFTTSAATGQTVYCLVKRDSDGYLLRASNGAFETGLTATQAGQILTENGTIKGLYEGTENRNTWNDGSYTFVCYAESVAGTINPSGDLILGINRVSFKSDTEINFSELYSLTTSLGALISSGGIAGILKSSLEDLGNKITSLYSMIRDLQQKMAKSGVR